jgi:hypothetical protein
MQKFHATILLALCGLAGCSTATAGAQFPRLLPPASDFHLTLREKPHGHSPLGPSCGGEASITLTCRAFTLTLQNASKHTIHISGLRCSDPYVVFEEKEPRSNPGWLPISQPGGPPCTTLDWINLRLKPGQKIRYTTRLISPRRSITAIDFLGPGSYTLRAHWALFGCTELHEGKDCLTRLQVVRPGSTAPDVGVQEPVTVLSNEITVESPPLPDLGSLKFAFDVSVASGDIPKTEADRLGVCATAPSARVDCMLFRYSVRNVGDRAVRYARFACSDFSITPEFRSEGADWEPVRTLMWSCSRNFSVETAILPGQASEGTFRIATLGPGAYDPKVFQKPGEYDLRFRFMPSACIASPDGSFCLVRPEKQPMVLSSIISVRVPESSPLN